jgi:ABC-type transporter Mla subunit MlaD
MPSPELQKTLDDHDRCVVLNYDFNRTLKSLKKDTADFFHSNFIFYQYKPPVTYFSHQSTDAYQQSFDALKIAINNINDASITSLKEDVKQFSDEATKLNSDMVDKKGIKTAALSYVQQREGGGVTQTLAQLTKECEEFRKNAEETIGQVGEAKEEIKSSSSTFWSVIDKARQASKGTLRATQRAGKTAGQIVSSSGQAIIAGGQAIGEGMVKLAVAPSDALNDVVSGARYVKNVTGDKARSLIGRSAHTSTQALLERLNALEEVPSDETLSHINKLLPFTTKQDLKDRINEFFISPEYYQIIPKGPFENQETSSIRKYIRSEHMPLTEMIGILTNTLTSLEQLDSHDKRQEMLNKIENYKRQLVVRKSFKNELVELRKITASTNTTELQGDVDKELEEINSCRVELEEKIKKLEAELKANYDKQGAFKVEIAAKEKEIDEINKGHDEQLQAYENTDLDELPETNSESNVVKEQSKKQKEDEYYELDETIFAQEYALTELLKQLKYNQANNAQLIACKTRLNALEENFKDSEQLIVYLNQTDQIKAKLEEIASVLRRGSKLNSIGNMNVILILDAGVRAGYDLGIAALYAKVGMTIILQGNLAIIDTREIMFTHRISLCLTMRSQANLGVPEGSEEYLKPLSITPPPELLNASVQAKCSLIDIRACHVYGDEKIWAARWSHEISSRIVFLTNYKLGGKLITTAWLDKKFSYVKEVAQRNTDTESSKLDGERNKSIATDEEHNELLKEPYKLLYFNSTDTIVAEATLKAAGFNERKRETQSSSIKSFSFSQCEPPEPPATPTPLATEESDPTAEIELSYWDRITNLFSRADPTEVATAQEPAENLGKPIRGGNLTEIKCDYVNDKSSGQSIYHHYKDSADPSVEYHYLEVSQKTVNAAKIPYVQLNTVGDMEKNPTAPDELNVLATIINLPVDKLGITADTQKVTIPLQAFEVGNVKKQDEFSQELFLRLESVASGGEDIIQKADKSLDKLQTAIQRLQEKVNKIGEQANTLTQQAQDKANQISSETQNIIPTSQGSELITQIGNRVQGTVQQGEDGFNSGAGQVSDTIQSVRKIFTLNPSASSYMRCILQPRMKTWPLSEVITQEWAAQVFRGYSFAQLSITTPNAYIPIMPGLDAYVKGHTAFTREIAQYEVLGTDTFSYLIMLNKRFRKTPIADCNIKAYIDLHWLEIETLLQNVTDTKSGAFAELWQSVKNPNKGGNVAARKLGKACFDTFRPKKSCPFIFINWKYISDSIKERKSYEKRKLDFETLVSNKIDAYNQTAVNLKKMTVDLAARRTKLEELLEQYNTVEALYNTSKAAFLTKFNDKVTHKIELVDLAALKQYIEKIKSYTGYQSHQLNIRPNLKSIREAYVSGKTTAEIINGARDELLSFYKLSLGIDTSIHDHKNLLSIDMAFCEAFNKEATIINRTDMKRLEIGNEKYRQMSNDYWQWFATSLLSQKNINLIEKTPPKNSILSSFSKKEFNKSVGSPININPLGRFIVPDMDGPHAWDPDRGVYVRGLIMWKSNQTHALRGALTELEKPLTNVPDPFKHANLEYYNNVPEESRNRFTTYFDRRLTAIDTFLGAIKNWKKGKEEETSNRMPNVVMLLEVPGLLEKQSIIRMQLQSALRWEIRTQMQELDQLNKTVPVEGQGIAPIIVPVIKPEEDLKELLMAYLNESNDRFEHEPLLHGLKQ